MTDKAGRFAVALDGAQWDLVVMALDYVHSRAREPAATTSFQPIDIFGRRLARRRLTEIIADIRAVVPDAGKGDE